MTDAVTQQQNAQMQLQRHWHTVLMAPEAFTMAECVTWGRGTVAKQSGRGRGSHQCLKLVLCCNEGKPCLFRHSRCHLHVKPAQTREGRTSLLEEMCDGYECIHYGRPMPRNGMTGMRAIESSSCLIISNIRIA